MTCAEPLQCHTPRLHSSQEEGSEEPDYSSAGRESVRPVAL